MQAQIDTHTQKHTTPDASGEHKVLLYGTYDGRVTVKWPLKHKDSVTNQMDSLAL